MRILLVEDVRAMAAVMAARLTSFGHEVSVAENGEMGVERFAEMQPELVLMDIEMPVMNGFAAANRIRALEANQRWAWTPIIFLTASDTPENLVMAIEAGGDDFLSKTVPPAVLEAKMKAMARIAALRQRLSVANRKLEELASCDGLTGLANRRAMDLRFDSAWVEAQRTGRPLALLVVDVDNFKNFNDRYGHLAGDGCLRAVAQAIRAAVDGFLGGEAFAARYGGEEFALVVTGADDAGYRTLAASLLEAVRGCAIPHLENGVWGLVTVSIGGAWLPKADGEIITMFRTADARLYQAKAAGRNRAELG